MPVSVAHSLVACSTVALALGSFAACGTTSPTAATPVVEVEGSGFVTRTLTRSKFLAFGDSITKGTSSPASTLFGSAGIPTSYPALLQEALVDLYLDPTITVINEGKGGEQTPDGRHRVGRELNTHRPDVLMILEGVNNLLNIGPAQTERDLESMVKSGQSAGADVLLATMTPITDPHVSKRPGLKDAIRDLNSRIRGIARRRRIDPVVDLFRAFEGRPGLIGQDGLHPTLEGHRVIAEEFLDTIVSRFETESLSSLSVPPAGIPPPVDASGEGPSQN